MQISPNHSPYGYRTSAALYARPHQLRCRQTSSARKGSDIQHLPQNSAWLFGSQLATSSCREPSRGRAPAGSSRESGCAWSSPGAERNQKLSPKKLKFSAIHLTTEFVPGPREDLVPYRRARAPAHRIQQHPAAMLLTHRKLDFDPKTDLF